MTFPAYGFVLLALPKCASTAIEAALSPHAELVIDKPPGMKHLGVNGFEKRIAPRLLADGHPRDAYEVVSMFRDPIAWLESWWRYRSRPDAGSSTQDWSFEEFARAYTARDRQAPVPRGRPAQFLTRRDGSIGVDRILAVERPDTWQAWFVEKLGQALDFPARNVSEAPDRGVLADDTLAELRRFFGPEYAVSERLAATGMWASARGTHLPGVRQNS